MTMKLFPHILTRLGGGAFEKLESLNLSASSLLAIEIHQLQESLEDVRNRITERLYSLIPQAEDPVIRKQLINCRRSVHNLKELETGVLDEILAFIPASLKEDLKHYLLIKEALQELWDKGEQTFQNEIKRLRENFHKLVSDETLQKGLLLSSHSLLDCIRAYLSKPAPENKKEFQTERGLMKYISRMYAKTSPFSTFTNLAMARIAPLSSDCDSFLGLETNGKSEIPNNTDHIPVIHHIRLNNLLFKYIKTLLLKNGHIHMFFPIRRNPTIKKEKDNFLYLTNSDNIEAFQRIPVNDVLDLLLGLISQNDNGISLKNLTDEILGKKRLDVPEEELHTYITELIDLGFLEFNMGVSGIDPDWDKRLRLVLENLMDESPLRTEERTLIEELRDVLLSLKQMAGTYGNASCEERLKILKNGFNLFKSICMKLHENAGLPEEERIPVNSKNTVREESINQQGLKNNGNNGNGKIFIHKSSTFFPFKPEHLFYEDTTATVSPVIDEPALREFMGIMHHLLQTVERFESVKDERDKMRHYFIHKYGETASIPLMQFYEDYSREFKKPEMERLLKQNKEGIISDNKTETPADPLFDITRMNQRHEKNRLWLDTLKLVLKEEFTPGSPVLDIHPRQLEKTRQKTGEAISISERTCSYGAFIQFYFDVPCDDIEINENATSENPNREIENKPKLLGVLNATFPGFGKFFSRFLHLFDSNITDNIRSWNLSLQKETLLAEDTDASYFNANLHPPLLPMEIRIPGGHNTLPADQHIPIDKINIRMNDTGTRLQADHTELGKRIYPIDLGFQGHAGRSQLFRLLDKLSLAQYLDCNSLINTAISASRNGNPETAEIIFSPRIIYDGRIIISRKTWQIPLEKLPFRSVDETQWSYFVRVDGWRRKLQIPDEVFIHVVEQKHSSGEKMPPSHQAPSQDDYKPQYICFKNPFLVDLFERILKRVPKTLKIVEMLPDSAHLLSLENRRYISEFTLQWYTGQKVQGDNS